MIGNNSLTLNEATMIDIVQYWLDNKLLNKDEKSPTVKGVKAASRSGYENNTFEISLTIEK